MKTNTYFYLKIISACLELMGVFLLSVEAMKLENFVRLRDKVLSPLHHLLNPPILSTKQGKYIRITVESDSFKKAIDYARQGNWKIMFNGFVWTISTFLSLGCLLTFCMMEPPQFGMWRWLNNLETSRPLVGKSLALIIVPVAMFYYSLTLYTICVGLLQGPMRLLSFIEKKTPAGTIGFLGFGAFLISFILRNYLEFAHLAR